MEYRMHRSNSSDPPYPVKVRLNLVIGGVSAASTRDRPMPDISSVPASPPRLEHRLRDACRGRHYSLRTEETYWMWARQSILFHGKRHPDDPGAAEISAFLTHLAVARGGGKHAGPSPQCSRLPLRGSAATGTGGVRGSSAGKTDEQAACGPVPGPDAAPALKARW